LHYYETLHAKDFKHRIVKRGNYLPSNNQFNKIKEVEFKALGRKFKLILNPHREVFHKNFRAYSTDADGNETIIHMDHESFFRGRVFGETESHVMAHIDSGVITASISLPEETYHIEPSWRHIPGTTDKHMVAYRASDVKLSWDHNHDSEEVPMKCGYVKEGLGILNNLPKTLINQYNPSILKFQSSKPTTTTKKTKIFGIPQKPMGIPVNHDLGKNDKPINTNIHRQKHGVLYYWSPIIDSSKKWAGRTLRPPFLIW
jgi:hypothetical protein